MAPSLPPGLKELQICRRLIGLLTGFSGSRIALELFLREGPAEIAQELLNSTGQNSVNVAA